MVLAGCVDTETCPKTPAPPVLHSGLEVAGPAGLDPKALATMMAHAKETGSDAIVILKDGKVAVEEHFTAGKQPIMAMSATKSISALALGAIANEDPEFSLDEPIAPLWPQMHPDAERAKITLRNILSHTTGLSTERAKWFEGESIGDHYWKVPMHTGVGEDFRYNNGAVDFLAVYTYAKTGNRLDDYLQANVFGPIGVRGAFWRKDNWGNPLAAGEISMEPLELAKIGQLMLQDGMWDGKRILAEGWVAQSTKPSQSFNEGCGLLWWLDAKRTVTLTSELLGRYEAAGVPVEIVAKLRPIVDRPFPSGEAIREARNALLSADERKTFASKTASDRIESGRTKLTGPVRAYMALGWIGQQLVVVPSKKLVAVRMRAWTKADAEDSTPHEYPKFPKDVRALMGDVEE